MAGYWPSFFFACLRTETKSRSINSQKRTRPISSHLDEQTWSIKDLFYCFKRNFACGIQRVVPSGPPSCPLGQPITARDLVHLARSRSQPYNKKSIKCTNTYQNIFKNQICLLPYKNLRFTETNYNDYFSVHLNNVKRIWKRIKQIIVSLSQ